VAALELFGGGKVTYREPFPLRLAPNTIIESTFDVGRRFRCTMRIERGQLYPGAAIGRHPAKAPAHARAPRRGGACGLARGPRCGSALTVGALIAARRRIGQAFFPTDYVSDSFMRTQHDQLPVG
jgi:hypothetical protein